MTAATAVEASDLELAQKSATGDQTAFGELYERYFDCLTDFAARTVGATAASRTTSSRTRS